MKRHLTGVIRKTLQTIKDRIVCFLGGCARSFFELFPQSANYDCYDVDEVGALRVDLEEDERNQFSVLGASGLVDGDNEIDLVSEVSRIYQEALRDATPTNRAFGPASRLEDICGFSEAQLSTTLQRRMVYEFLSLSTLRVNNDANIPEGATQTARQRYNSLLTGVDEWLELGDDDYEELIAQLDGERISLHVDSKEEFEALAEGFFYKALQDQVMSCRAEVDDGFCAAKEYLSNLDFAVNEFKTFVDRINGQTDGDQIRMSCQELARYHRRSTQTFSQLRDSLAIVGFTQDQILELQEQARGGAASGEGIIEAFGNILEGVGSSLTGGCPTVLDGFTTAGHIFLLAGGLSTSLWEGVIDALEEDPFLGPIIGAVDGLNDFFGAFQGLDSEFQGLTQAVSIAYQRAGCDCGGGTGNETDSPLEGLRQNEREALIRQMPPEEIQRCLSIQDQFRGLENLLNAIRANAERVIANTNRNPGVCHELYRDLAWLENTNRFTEEIALRGGGTARIANQSFPRWLVRLIEITRIKVREAIDTGLCVQINRVTPVTGDLMNQENRANIDNTRNEDLFPGGEDVQARGETNTDGRVTAGDGFSLRTYIDLIRDWRFGGPPFDSCEMLTAAGQFMVAFLQGWDHEGTPVLESQLDINYRGINHYAELVVLTVARLCELLDAYEGANCEDPTFNNDLDCGGNPRYEGDPPPVNDRPPPPPDFADSVDRGSNPSLVATSEANGMAEDNEAFNDLLEDLEVDLPNAQSGIRPCPDAVVFLDDALYSEAGMCLQEFTEWITNVIASLNRSVESRIYCDRLDELETFILGPLEDAEIQIRDTRTTLADFIAGDGMPDVIQQFREALNATTDACEEDAEPDPGLSPELVEDVNIPRVLDDSTEVGLGPPPQFTPEDTRRILAVVLQGGVYGDRKFVSPVRLSDFVDQLTENFDNLLTNCGLLRRFREEYIDPLSSGYFVGVAQSDTPANAEDLGDLTATSHPLLGARLTSRDRTTAEDLAEQVNALITTVTTALAPSNCEEDGPLPVPGLVVETEEAVLDPLSFIALDREDQNSIAIPENVTNVDRDTLVVILQGGVFGERYVITEPDFAAWVRKLHNRIPNPFLNNAGDQVCDVGNIFWNDFVLPMNSADTGIRQSNAEFEDEVNPIHSPNGSEFTKRFRLSSQVKAFAGDVQRILNNKNCGVEFSRPQRVLRYAAARRLMVPLEDAHPIVFGNQRAIALPASLPFTTDPVVLATTREGNVYDLMEVQLGTPIPLAGDALRHEYGMSKERQAAQYGDQPMAMSWVMPIKPLFKNPANLKPVTFSASSVVRYDNSKPLELGVPFKPPKPRKVTRGKLNTLDNFMKLIKAPNGWVNAKYDGIRCLFHVWEGGFAAFTEQGEDLTDQLPGYEQRFRSLNLKSAIFDAEIEMWVDGKKMPFEQVTAQLNSNDFNDDELVVNVFDVVFHEGRDLTNTAIEDRIELMFNLFPSQLSQSTTDTPKLGVINVTPYTRVTSQDGLREEALALWQKPHLEGVVFKKAGSLYRTELERPFSQWFKVRKSIAIQVTILKRNNTKRDDLFTYDMGLIVDDASVFPEDVFRLRGTAYMRLGKSLPTNEVLDPGDPMFIEVARVDLVENDVRGSIQLSVRSPRNINKTLKKLQKKG